MVSYRVMLDVPRELIWFVSGLLAARRREIGTRRGTRRLGCYRQALFALAWFRDKGDIPRLGRGFGLPQSTAYRYLDEVIEVLAARAPGLQEQLERALAEGVPYLILDGKVVDADRCREKTVSRKGKVIDLWYAGKTHDFGGNIQALFYPSGIPLWVSDVLPGNVHDLAAARENVLGVLRPFLEAMPVLADPGYEGAGHGVHVPVLLISSRGCSSSPTAGSAAGSCGRRQPAPGLICCGGFKTARTCQWCVLSPTGRMSRSCSTPKSVAAGQPSGTADQRISRSRPVFRCGSSSMK